MKFKQKFFWHYRDMIVLFAVVMLEKLKLMMADELCYFREAGQTLPVLNIIVEK